MVDLTAGEAARGVGGEEEVSFEEEEFEGAWFSGGEVRGGFPAEGGGFFLAAALAAIGSTLQAHFGMLVGEVEEAAGELDCDGLVAIE